MNDRGSAVVLAAFTMVILFFLGTALVELSKLEFHVSNNQVDEVKAYYIAEAGIEKALAKMRLDQEFLKQIIELGEGCSLTIPVAESFGGGNFSNVDLKMKKKAADCVIINLENVGTFNRAKKRILVKAKVFTTGLLSFEEGVSIGSVDSKKGTITGSEEIISDFIFRSSVNIQTCRVVGDVTGYDVTIGNSACVEGNVNYVNSFNGEPSQVTGTVTKIDAINLPPLPVVSSQQYRAVAEELEETPGTRVFAGGYNSGVFDLSTKESGIYFVNGDLILKGTYTGDITVVATGKITIDKTGVRTSDRTANVLTVVSFQEIEIGNGDIEALLYVTSENGSEGKLSLSGNGTFAGAAIADVLAINGTVQLQFDAGLAGQKGPGIPASIQIVHWREGTDIL